MVLDNDTLEIILKNVFPEEYHEIFNFKEIIGNKIIDGELWVFDLKGTKIWIHPDTGRILDIFAVEKDPNELGD